MKKVLAFDIDQTLNVAKTPITDDIAELLVKCLDHFEICPISGQKFDQFLTGDRFFSSRGFHLINNVGGFSHNCPPKIK